MGVRVGPMRLEQPLMFARVEGDPSIVLGIGLSLLIVGAAVALGGNFLQFIDISGLLLVVGGTFGATLANYSLKDMGFAWKALVRVIRIPARDPLKRIRRLASLNQSVRAEGLMALDREARYERDPFFRRALELVVDGTPLEDIRRILETEMRSSHERFARAVQVFETLGSYAPALGLIGTLVGLVKMLGALNDPTTVGPAMALALLTTLYGALAANVFFLPVAGKLRNRGEEEWVLKSIALEGASSIAKQENTIVMEQRLNSFLPGRG